MYSIYAFGSRVLSGNQSWLMSALTWDQTSPTPSSFRATVINSVSQQLQTVSGNSNVCAGNSDWANLLIITPTFGALISNALRSSKGAANLAFKAMLKLISTLTKAI